MGTAGVQQLPARSSRAPTEVSALLQSTPRPAPGPVTALYALQLRPGATGRLATMQLRWQDPQTFAVSEINGNVNTWDLAPAFEQASARYQLAVTVAQYAELLRRSPWAQGSSLAQVSGYANRIAQAFPEDADVQEFAQLVNRAWQLGW